MKRNSNGGRHQVRADLLSPRENEVLTLVGEGLSNETIAERMCIGRKSIENYLNRLYAEFDLTKETYYHKRVALVLCQTNPISHLMGSSVSSRCASLSWNSGQFYYVSG